MADMTAMTAEQLAAQVRAVIAELDTVSGNMGVDDKIVATAMRELTGIAARLSGMAAVPNLRELIMGMSVSIDVSTCEADESHRYFGTVTEVMDDPDDKHGVTLLVQDAEPNFTSAAPEPPHV